MPIVRLWTTPSPRPLGPPIPGRHRDGDVTLRGGDPVRDGAAVARLAAMDDVPVPAPPWLVAGGQGELRAVLSLHDGTSVADPFWPSGALVELLRERAAQLDRARAARRAGRFRRGVVRALGHGG